VVDCARFVGATLLPPRLATHLQGLHVSMKPIAVHAMVLAAFASLVAPFGESRLPVRGPAPCMCSCVLAFMCSCAWHHEPQS
jgi:hypothetical protein